MSNTATMMGLGSGAGSLAVADAFSTTLYTGASGTTTQQTITNGIDLTEGGLVWVKVRNAAIGHYLVDTERGAGQFLQSNGTGAETDNEYTISGFTSSGFTLGQSYSPYFSGGVWGANNYVSWTWRKAPKFFDVVKYSGTGSSGHVIDHALNNEVGMILIKNISAGAGWKVWHRSLASGTGLVLNSTNSVEGIGYINNNNNDVTDSSITIGVAGNETNTSGNDYIMYLFAHNEDLIQCGSYVGNGSSTGTVVDLGFEPQWLLIKKSTGGAQDWALYDNMRGLVSNGDDARLSPNTSGDELNGYQSLSPTSTGFQLNSAHDWVNTNNETYVYMAIKKA